MHQSTDLCLRSGSGARLDGTHSGLRSCISYPYEGRLPQGRPRFTVPASRSGDGMPTNKRITDLSDYTSILPYASELFGVYQPLIGWKSKRVLKRLNKGMNTGPFSRFAGLAGRYQGIVSAHFDGCFIGL